MNPKHRARIIDQVRSFAEVVAIVAINVAAWATTWQTGLATAGITILAASYAYGKDKR